MIMLLTVLIMLMVLVFAFLFLSASSIVWRSGVAYECGFSSYSKSNSGVSLQFMSFMILFLLFDLEVILLLPILLGWSWLMVFIAVVFLSTLWAEHLVGSVEWSE